VAFKLEAGIGSAFLTCKLAKLEPEEDEALGCVAVLPSREISHTGGGKKGGK
jgi:hypothetical protein